MRVAFIGLGVMGLPMARNLIGAGHDVVGFTRSAAKAQPFVEDGGRLAGSAREAAEDVEAVITMLPDSLDVQAAHGD